MSAISSRFETVARVLPKTDETYSAPLSERLATLYALAQKSNYVFASPLGPFFDQGRHQHVPRFVYFGPHTHDQSLRLAFLTGFDGKNLEVALALTHFVEALVASPDLGQGLNLSFFPLVDVLGAARGQTRDLASAHWAHSAIPEIEVLEKDARARGYHGFVRLEATAENEEISVRFRNENVTTSVEPEIELVTSEDFDPWPVVWEDVRAGSPISDGPLTVVDDLPVRPFELRIPPAAKLDRRSTTRRYACDFTAVDRSATFTSILWAKPLIVHNFPAE